MEAEDVARRGRAAEQPAVLSPLVCVYDSCGVFCVALALLRARPPQAGRAAGVEVLGERGPDRRAAGEVWSLADLYFFAVLGSPLPAKRVAPRER